MSQGASPTGVHLVGSLPFDTSEDVFRATCDGLANHLKRIPDGETQERNYFVGFQNNLLKHLPQIQRKFEPTWPRETGSGIPLDEIPGLVGELETGYDTAALASYQKFVELRNNGVIPGGVKFQVSVPTPLNGLVIVADPLYQATIEPIYEAAIMRAVRNIQDKIPHQDLAIQWDCAVDFGMLEGVYNVPEGGLFLPWFEPVREGVLNRISKACGNGTVDDDVEMGFHLCYGDMGHKHYVEPKDTSMMSMVIKHIYTTIGRKIDWIHLPVPIDRTDQAYLESLKDVTHTMKTRGTTLYLGLVHAADEIGTWERIETAKRVVGDLEWGVATECGMGRTPKEQISGILEISRTVSSAVRRPSSKPVVADKLPQVAVQGAEAAISVS